MGESGSDNVVMRYCIYCRYYEEPVMCGVCMDMSPRERPLWEEAKGDEEG